MDSGMGVGTEGNSMGVTLSRAQSVVGNSQAGSVQPGQQVPRILVARTQETEGEGIESGLPPIEIN